MKFKALEYQKNPADLMKEAKEHKKIYTVDDLFKGVEPPLNSYI